ncbi:unnamed protein product [Musa acuminata subsp. malaccensis]|uniref:(wild Malaysian banana) hypothetical protein n=1 Tax=Musa acuminata subsp. malaccensis TaxID=214687 RepID=A0A804HUJ6_MUSAM|nr:unnamed protein product [Musa acuminata subsp. malaccensis]
MKKIISFWMGTVELSWPTSGPAASSSTSSSPDSFPSKTRTWCVCTAKCSRPSTRSRHGSLATLVASYPASSRSRGHRGSITRSSSSPPCRRGSTCRACSSGRLNY